SADERRRKRNAASSQRRTCRMGKLEWRRHGDTSAATAALCQGDSGAFLIRAAVDGDQLARDKTGDGRDGDDDVSRLRGCGRASAARRANRGNDGGFA